MILDALPDLVTWLILTVPPIAGLLRAYSFDRFDEKIGSRLWLAGAAVMVLAFVVFASPWGLSLLANGLADALPDIWDGGLRTVYRVVFLAAYVGTPVAAAVGVHRWLPAKASARRAAAVAIAVALLAFLLAQYPAVNQSHCPLFRDGLIVDGWCATEG